MSKRFALCAVTTDGSLRPMEEFEKLDEARKRVKQAKIGELDQGSYTIIEFCNRNIQIGPPPEATRLAVSMGETFITRVRKPKAEGGPVEEGTKPKRSRGGLFGGNGS